MISVVLNGFKRSYNFSEQLKAINNQTVKPKEILLWQNKGDIFDEISTKKTIHANCNKNLGVWARFAYALNCKSKFICIFDDDTIPGPRWFENCLKTIKKYNGLLGARGVKFHSTKEYFVAKEYGWKNPNEKVEVVDIVGHSWFFKRDLLSTFWREFPSSQISRVVGEDIHFSYTIQKYLNLKTYVPPHPANNLDLWGSLPKYANIIGSDPAAIFLNEKNKIQMNKAYKFYIKRGFKINPTISDKIFGKIKKKLHTSKKKFKKIINKI